MNEFDTISNGPSVTITTEDVRTVFGASTAHAAAGQEIGIAADFSIAAGWHIYGQPLLANYPATAIVFDGDYVATHSCEFPNPEKVSFPEIGETLPVFTGAFRVKGKILVRSGLKPGNYELKGRLHFQECNNQICKIPQSVAFAIPFTIDPMTPAVPK